MHRIKSLHEQIYERQQVRNYLDLVHLCDINDAVPEEFDCPSIRFPPPKSIYYPYDYKDIKNIKQIFGEI